MTRNRSDTTTIDEAMTRFNCDRWFSVTESTGIRVWRNGKTRQYDYTQQRRDRLYWLYVSDLSGRLYTANQTTWLVLWPRRGAL